MNQSLVNLRIATLRDYEIVESFASNLIKTLPYNAAQLTERAKKIIKQALIGNKENIIILIVCQNQTPVGVLGATVSEPLFCSSGEKMAVELLLYVDPSCRNPAALLNLLRAYKFWAKRVGCTYISYASYKNGIEMNRIKRLK